MKTQTKAIIASAVVVALALSAVAGVTYSWFSDSEEADVNITTGSINLDLPLDKITINNFGYSEIDVNTDGTNTLTEIGAFANATLDSESQSKKLNVNFSNVAINDSLNIYLKEGTITTSIKSYYSETVKVTDSEGNVVDSNPFKISGIAQSKVIDANDTTNNKIDSHKISITMGDGNEYQGKTYKISILFTVVQYNSGINSAAMINGQSYATVSDAVSNASNGDVIWISSGKQVVSGEFRNKNLTINGSLDGSSVLDFTSNPPSGGSNESEYMILNNLTINITNEDYKEYFDTKDLTMNNCVVNGQYIRKFKQGNIIC